MNLKLKQLLKQLATALAMLILLQVAELYSYTRLRSIYIPASDFSPNRAYLLDGALVRGTIAIYNGQEFISKPSDDQSELVRKIQIRHPNTFNAKLIVWQLDDNEKYLWYRAQPNWTASLAFILLVAICIRLLARIAAPNSPYLKAGRLGDVLALTQVLAIDKRTYRSEDGIAKALNTIPGSAKSWTEIALEHGELFRVNQQNVNSIALVVRHAQEAPNGESSPCSNEQLSKLLSLAIDIHDRAMSRSQRWQVWVPVVASTSAALVAAMAAIARRS